LIPPTGQIPLNVIVFIDYQNTYNDARRAFCERSDPATYGQINPMRLGSMLASRQPLGTTAPRNLKEVRIYRGRPESSKEPKTYGAHMRQCATWDAAGAVVVHRPLRYPHDWPASKPEEKGIDVQIAVDLMTMSIRGDLDVAILFSTDTDLRPALEAFPLLTFDAPRTIEVASWKSPVFKKALRVPGQHVWCHFLEEDDFRSVRDTRDYNIRR
jgi:uncharacterized LabA/DUF88 family protein